MDLIRAKEILSSLADGIDPLTGEVFPSDSPYQQAEIVRALLRAVHSLDTTAPLPKPRKLAPTNAGQAWGVEQEQELLALALAGNSTKDIAAQMGRTRGAIRSRLEKMGLMKQNE
jgi:DNA-binding NarL/FixJ family response regulator